MCRVLRAAALSALACGAAPALACGSRGSGAPATSEPAHPPLPAPVWRDVAPIGKIALDLPGALIPRGADAIVPVPGAQPAVYALKRDFAASAVYHVEFGSPSAPTVGLPLILKGPTSEPAALGDALVVGVLEAGRPPEAVLIRGGSPPRVIARVRLDEAMLGPIAVRGDTVYLASATVEGLPEPAAPQLVALRLTYGAGGPDLATQGMLPLSAPAHALAVSGDRLVVALAETPPIHTVALTADGGFAPGEWSGDYRIVQKLKYGEYAFDATPHHLASAGERLVLASDPHTVFVPLRIDDPPRPTYPPPFHHARGGGLLAVDHAGGDGGPVLYRLRGRRVYVDGLDTEGHAVPEARWRIGMTGAGRALALLPALLIAADDAFGLYLFPR